MKDITWTGEERNIPNYGVVKKGTRVSMPDEMAESFVEKQKLAKYTHKSSTKTEEGS